MLAGELSAVATAQWIREGRLSPVEAVEAALERVKRRNPVLNAFVTVLAEQARERALAAERALRAGGPLGPLHGVPIALKDLFDAKAGVRNTFGSLVFADFVPDTDANHVARLEAAGAIVIGKTNTPEFGYKGTTDNLLFGPTRSPFDLATNAGGSSGGSAAAVAAGMVPLAQGSDGGGSVRIPAALSGVVGFKATFGVIPLVTRPDGFLGHTPYAHVGPLSRTVEDAALMLGVLAGPDARDPLSLPAFGLDLGGAALRGVRGLRIAYSPDYGGFPIEPAVAEPVAAAAAAFEELGAEVEAVQLTLPRPHHELAAMWTRTSGVRAAETVAAMRASGIDLLGEHRDRLDPYFLRKVEAAQEVRAIDYRLDDVARTEVYDALQAVFERFDLLVGPTLSVAKVDNADDGLTMGPATVEGEEVDRAIGWCPTYLQNFTGHPAISIPAGFTPEGWPVGLHISGPRFADARVLAAAAAFERARPWSEAYERARPWLTDPVVP